MKSPRKPQRSLRTILILWFLLFSVVPLGFVTGYSVIKYEKAIDNELFERLTGNAREIGSILNDFRSGLENRRDRYKQDTRLAYSLSMTSTAAVRDLLKDYMRGDYATTLTAFNRDGRMLASVFKDNKGEIREFPIAPNSALFLPEKHLKVLQMYEEHSLVEFAKNRKLSLVLLSRIENSAGKTVGFLEQLLELDRSFLDRLKKRMKLEFIILNPEGGVAVATHSDYYLYKKETFQQHLKKDQSTFFELNLRSVPYGFALQPLKWGNSTFYVGLGASKEKAKETLRNVNYAFYAVVGGLIILIVILIFLTSNVVLRPLQELLEATNQLKLSDTLMEIPIKSDTEIGLLTESFNEMSRSVLLARTDLKKKLQELERANSELKEAQSQLVHSSKMVSLGQLVAGVAHELNNPIGFIYSNVSHLSDYADRLIELSKVAELSGDAAVTDAKKRLDIDFVRKDLEKIIKSCEDGARRVRDIVLGLRNFSRLEESKDKELDLHESIENTLQIISGEVKNRVEVHKNFGNIPKLRCNPSQINQVFMNLLTNAAQAIKGNGDIWISTKMGQEPSGKDAIIVSIQDTGHGIPKDIIEKIFDPFFTTKDVGQGTGLGLSITYGIIKNHGGHIEVRSQPNVGTEFTLYFPV